MRKLIAVVAAASLFAPAVAQSPRPPAFKGAFFAAVPPKAFLLEIGDVRAKSGRVPRGYGQLGLTKEQKERVYGIQAAYAARIDELEAEIEKLKEEQFLRIKSVLSDSQRFQIERYELQATAKKAGEE